MVTGRKARRWLVRGQVIARRESSQDCNCPVRDVQLRSHRDSTPPIIESTNSEVPSRAPLEEQLGVLTNRLLSAQCKAGSTPTFESQVEAVSAGADDGQRLVAEWLLIDAYCVVAPGQLPSARKTAPEVSGPLSRDPYIRFVTDALYSDVLSQFAVADNVSSSIVGLVTSYNERLSIGTCYAAFQRCRPRSSSGAGGEMVSGMLLFLDYLFATFPLRKVYFEVPGYNRGILGGAVGGLMDVEGELTEYYFHAGEYWNNIIFSLSRDRWEELSASIFSASSPTDAV